MNSTLTFDVIAPDGSWCGSSPRDVVAEQIQEIYPGSIIVISDHSGPMLATAPSPA